MSPTAPADWYPDPHGRHELRWFDGSGWTDHVCSNGQQGIDPQPVAAVPFAEVNAQGGATVPRADLSAERFEKSLAKVGLDAGDAGGCTGHLMTESVLVVSQKAKFVELTNEYAVLNQAGAQVGAVREIGQSTARKVLRFATNVDQFLTHRYEVVDMDGNIIFSMVRPAKFLKSKVQVSDAMGTPIGEIVQENALGKIHFGLNVEGQRLGSINAENWRAWNFNIQDAGGAEIARITKTFSGLARATFTSADNYVVQIDPTLQGPLRVMAVAAAVSVDTALKQDSR